MNQKLKTTQFVYDKGNKKSLAEFSQSEKKPDLVIIWLHGLGASGDDFVPVVPMLNLNATIHYIFPFAPNQPVSINGKMIMPSWYDILEIIEERKIDDNQFNISVGQIQSIIDEQILAGIDSEKILLIGFSQGGAVAINSALTYAKPLAGVLALSTYVAKEPIISEKNTHLPVFWIHGEYDNVVPLSLAKKAEQFFKQKSNPFSLKIYPMMHEVSLDEIREISKIIQKIAD